MQFGIFSVSDITRDPVSGDTPSTTAPVRLNRGKASRNSHASVVQPAVSSFG